MQNAKGANARKIGPMTEAVAQELRAELARQKRSAKSLAESAGLNRSTLHKTLNAQRAIDVDDLFHLADLLDVSPSEVFAKAEILAREMLDDGQLPAERAGMPADHDHDAEGAAREQEAFDASSVGGSSEYGIPHIGEVDVEALRQSGVALAADERDGIEEEQEQSQELP
ncbi:helix-turn-helix domain-containing protein [Leucobacter sp.]